MASDSTSKVPMLLLGSHVPMTKPRSLLGSVEQALKMNATSFMVFLGPPQNTRPADLDPDLVSQAQKLWNDNGRDVRNIVVHFRYVLNPSAPDEKKGKFAAEFFDKELTAMEKAGLSLCCFHPGSAVGTDRNLASDNLIRRLQPVFAKHPSIRIAVETMAGKGSEVGVGLMENALLIKKFNLPNVGSCLDTCHLWDAGMDVANIPEFLYQIETVIGFEKAFLVHLNDSLNPRGAHKDRHANLGQGFIGFKALSAICGLKELAQAPKILETPDSGDGSTHATEISKLYLSLGY